MTKGYDKTYIGRSDLIKEAEDKTIRQIIISDIRFSAQTIQLADVVIFLDSKKGLLRILKWRWKADFDVNGVFGSTEFTDIIKDALDMDKGLGQSLLSPGTDKFRK